MRTTLPLVLACSVGIGVSIRAQVQIAATPIAEPEILDTFTSGHSTWPRLSPESRQAIRQVTRERTASAGNCTFLLVSAAYLAVATGDPQLL